LAAVLSAVPGRAAVPAGDYAGTIGAAPVYLRTSGGAGRFDALYAYGAVPRLESESITVNATVAPDGTLDAVEKAWVTPQQFVETGRFRGTVQADGNRMTGQWSDGKKQVPFELHLVIRKRLVEAKGVDAGAGTLEFVDAADPVAALANRELAARATKLIARAESQHLAIDAGTELTFYSSGVISARWSWEEGSKSGGRESLVFGLRDGKPDRFELAQLFRPGAGWTQRVQEECVKVARAQNATLVGMLKVDPVAIESFQLEGKATFRFFLAFRPGTAAASQPFECAVPLVKLGDIVDPNGPLGPILARAQKKSK
jgi:hypothetical protein